MNKPVKMDGKALSSKIREQIKYEVLELKKRGITPGLCVILVGEDPASQIYVRNKQRACEEVGFHSRNILLPADVNQETLIDVIENVNNDPSIHAILVQLPLPKTIDTQTVLNTIKDTKDVDVFKDINLGKILTNTNVIAPCTPSGIVELLNEYNISPEGKHVVVVGRSNIVGKPVSLLMLNKNATVTICHSRTSNLKEVCKQADILISAVGKEYFITADMVKEGCTIIDVGINRNAEGKVHGDVHPDACAKSNYYTPVPGGVGPMTITMLLKNTLLLAKEYGSPDAY